MADQHLLNQSHQQLLDEENIQRFNENNNETRSKIGSILSRKKVAGGPASFISQKS
jgi:hypothetical protein